MRRTRHRHEVRAIAPPTVALVTDCYHPTRNGVTTMVALLADGLGAAGHRVVLIVPSAPRESSRTVESRAVAHPVPAVTHLVRSVPVLPSIRLRLALPGPGALTRLLRRERVELVHTHTEGPLGWGARAAAARLGVPAVHTLHTLYRHYLHYATSSPHVARPAARLLDAGLGRFLRGYDLVVSPSARGLAEVARLDSEIAVALVPNGVPADPTPPAASAARQRRAAVRTRLHLAEEDRVLLVVGRVAPEKRTEELLVALLPVVASRPRLRVVLVGGGPLLDRARRLVAGHGLERRVLLPGYLPHADVLALYPLADVLVSASHSENHPVSLLEAAAAGVPAAVLRDGGIDTHLTSATGIVADDDRSLALAAADLADDRARQRRLATAARRSAAAHSDIDHVAALRRHYTTLLGQTTQRSVAPATLGG